MLGGVDLIELRSHFGEPAAEPARCGLERVLFHLILLCLGLGCGFGLRPLEAKEAVDFVDLYSWELSLLLGL